jgi:HSP20 family protein
VQISVQGNVRDHAGERRAELRTIEAQYFHEEFSCGEFKRTLELPEGVNTEKTNAEFVNGGLQISAPVAAVALPRKIEINRSVPLRRQMAA